MEIVSILALIRPTGSLAHRFGGSKVPPPPPPPKVIQRQLPFYGSVIAQLWGQLQGLTSRCYTVARCIILVVALLVLDNCLRYHLQCETTASGRIWIRAPPTVYSGYKGVNGNLIVTLCSQVNNKASHQVSAFCVKYLSSYGKKCKSVQTWRKNEVKVSTTVTGLDPQVTGKKQKW